MLIATVQQQTGRKLSDPYWSKYCVSFGSDFIRLGVTLDMQFDQELSGRVGAWDWSSLALASAGV